MKSKLPYGYKKENTDYPKWKLIFKRKWTIIAITLVMLVVSAAFTFLQEKIYKADTVINFNVESIQKFLTPGKGSLENEINILNSDVFLTKLSESILKRKYVNPKTKAKVLPILNLSQKPSSKTQLISIIKNKLKSNLRIELDQVNNSIFISYLSSNPEESQIISNMISTELYQMSLLNSKANVVPLEKLLEEKKDEKQTEVNKSKLILQKLKQRGDVPDLSATERILIDKLAELESELESTDLQIKMYGIVLENYKRELQKLIPKKYNDLIEITDADIINLMDKIEKTEAKRTVKKVMRIYPDFKPLLSWTDFQVSDIKKLYDELDNLISVYTENIIKSQKNKNLDADLISKFVTKIQNVKLTLAKDDLIESIIYDALTELEPNYQRINFNKINLARLTREYTFNYKLLEKINNLLEKIKDREASSIAAIEYINYAQLPTSFYKPDVFLNLLFGGLLGLLIGIIIAYRLSLFATYIKEAEDLEILGYRIISTVPHINKNQSLLLDATNNNHSGDFLSENGNTEFDAFQRIYGYLRYGFLDKEIKSILITSSIKEEGKSLVASNLGIMLASHGHNVLLVDTNLKSPSLHKYFRKPSKPSLAHYLFRKEELDNVIKDTHVEGLKLITGIEFPQDSSVVLTSERMKKFVNLVYSKFDYIIYDALDVLSLEEVAFLATLIDEIIMVARINKTKITELKQVDKIFENYDVTPGGFVLNDITTSNKKGKTVGKPRYSKLPSRDDHYKRFQKNISKKVKRSETDKNI